MKLPFRFAVGALVLLFALSGPAPAQNTTPIPPGVDAKLNLEYAKVGTTSLLIDLFLPQNATKPMPVVLWIHGGGWKAGTKENPFVLPLLKYGFAVASINYRFSQEAPFPAQIQDCKAAVRWLRAHAPEYGIDPNRIGVGGDSAGGHLVALLGLTAGLADFEGNEGNPGVSSAVQAVCDYYGPTDMVFSSTNPLPNNPNVRELVNSLLGGYDDAKAHKASPLYYVTFQAAPFYIVHGDKDPIVPLDQSVQLNAALQKAGVPSTLHVVKGGGHGFHDPASEQEVLRFFQKYLQSPASDAAKPGNNSAKLSN